MYQKEGLNIGLIEKDQGSKRGIQYILIVLYAVYFAYVLGRDTWRRDGAQMLQSYIENKWWW